MNSRTGYSSTRLWIRSCVADGIETGKESSNDMWETIGEEEVIFATMPNETVRRPTKASAESAVSSKTESAVLRTMLINEDGTGGWIDTESSQKRTKSASEHPKGGIRRRADGDLL
jgi:hypothetical protein